MATRFFATAYRNLFSGNFDFTSDTFRVMILSSLTHSDTQEFVADVVANELTGYTRVDIIPSIPAYDNTNNRQMIAFADATLASVQTGQSYDALVYYKFVTNDSDSILLGYTDDLSGNTAGVDINIDFNALGLLGFDRLPA